MKPDNTVIRSVREGSPSTQGDPSATPQEDRQWEILLPTAAPHGFDYLAPAGAALSPGDIVTVPLGRSESLGVVWGKGAAPIPRARLKSILTHHAGLPALSEEMRRFIDWAAWYNCAPKGAILKMVLPIDDVSKESRLTFDAAAQRSDAFQLAPLSGMQASAAQALAGKLGQGFSVTLLDGVTGSGKTEVYFDTIACILRGEDSGFRVQQEKTATPESRILNPDPSAQVLILLPEIALSVQWLERFEKRFGFAPVIWHSEITPARKRVAWQAIAKGEARVVVGARSALFLPYRKLALVIVDEEHDASYKQEEGVHYHARDMAVARARFEQFPLVLASATPSLETYYNTKQGRYGEVALPARHGEADMPEVSMIDMRSAPLERGAFISQPLRERLTAALASGHQSMLFLNRRGYAPLLLCRHCGHRFECPHCSAWMVVHRKKRGIENRESGKKETPVLDSLFPIPDSYLQCHHCDHRHPVPAACPACAAEESFAACGPGVERLAEEVASFLPRARVAVMASDSAGNYKDMAGIIAAMAEKRLDLLIGTQMIAKGHHFAGLAVVGVVDADLGLAGGDLRAGERTYQLLHQLSGRAGRERVAGAVYLQSFLPDHAVMKALASGGRDAFLAAELEARRAARMPPFSRLAAVIVEGTNETQVAAVARGLAAAAPSSPKLRLLGPAPAPLYRLSGRFRWRLLIKADRSVNLPDYMRGWIEALSVPSAVRVRIDIDPVSFV